MTAREWKPGDVAMVGYDGQPERPMLRAEVERAHGLRACWLDPAYRIYEDQGRVQSARPLVVIDPEDRKPAVDIAQAAASAAGVDPGVDISRVINAVQAALREYANPTPPKPEEPTGLGAVVEDRWGYRFVFTGYDDGPWYNVNEDACCTWDHIAAVRVLSEGVTA